MLILNPGPSRRCHAQMLAANYQACASFTMLLAHPFCSRKGWILFSASLGGISGWPWIASALSRKVQISLGAVAEAANTSAPGGSSRTCSIGCYTVGCRRIICTIKQRFWQHRAGRTWSPWLSSSLRVRGISTTDRDCFLHAALKYGLHWKLSSSVKSSTAKRERPCCQSSSAFDHRHGNHMVRAEPFSAIAPLSTKRVEGFAATTPPSARAITFTARQRFGCPCR